MNHVVENEILDRIKDSGAKGCTFAELRGLLGYSRMTVYWNTRILEARGYIKDSGMRRQGPKGGNKATVWVAS